MFFKKRNSAVVRATQPLIENLEGRRLLSASLGAHGALTVTGTSGNDTINVSFDTHKKGTLDVTLNGKTSQFSATSVKTITINAGAGNDKVSESASVTDPTTELGGTGNDSLTAGNGNDSLDGGAGNDSLQAGTGNDTLLGSTGNDTIVAGRGHDNINGGTGTDNVDIPPQSGVAFGTLPPLVQSGLTSLAQGATITTVTVFQDDNQTFYGTIVPISGVNTRIVVDANGNPVSDAPSDGHGGSSDHSHVFGSVVSIDTINNMITVAVGSENGPATQSTFIVTMTTTITNAGAPVTLATLVTGTLVKIQTVAGDPTTAASINVVIPESHNHEDASGTLVGVDTINNTITIQGESGTQATYPLDPAATVTLDGAASTLGALPTGADVELRLSTDGKTVLSVRADTHSQDGNQAHGQLVSVDTVNNTITLAGEGGTKTTYNVTPSTTITLNEAASTLGALPAGAGVEVSLATDGVTALSIRAEVHGQHVEGSLVSVDTVNNTITLAGHGGTQTTYSVTMTTTITLNEAASTLGALPTGAGVEITLATDGVTALSINAQSGGQDHGQHAQGSLASVDTVKNTITLKGDGGTLTTYNVTMTTTITLNEAASTLGALPVGVEVEITLATDGVTALSINAQTHD